MDEPDETIMRMMASLPWWLISEKVSPDLSWCSVMSSLILIVSLSSLPVFIAEEVSRGDSNHL